MILVHVEVERNIKTVAEDRHNRKKGVIVVELDQFRYKISGFEKPMEQIKKSLDLENKKKTASYIYSVARTLSLEYLRRDSNQYYEDMDMLGSTHSDMDTYEFENVNEIQELIEKLPPNYSEILILKYVHEMENIEISQLLEITETNVRKLIERAKSALRKLCEERGVRI